MDYPTVHNDDPKQLIAARMFITGHYTYGNEHGDPYVRGYPFFAMHLLEWAYRGYERVMRHLAPATLTPREALAEREYMWFLRRLGLALNCLYELAGLGLVFVIGRRLFDPWAGLAAAGVFAVSSLHVQMAHIVGADLPQCLFVLGVFFFAVRLRERERLLDWLGAGVCAGLAAAAKYHGVLSLLALALVFLASRRREGWRSFFTARPWAGPGVVAAGFLAAFLLATPAVLLEPKAGIASIRAALRVSANFWVPTGLERGRLAFVAGIWYHYLNNLLRFFEPLPGWLTFVALGVFAVRRRLRESFLWVYALVLFPVGAYGFPVGVAYHYLGILTPLVWIIGFAVAEAVRALRKPWLRAGAVAVLGGWAFLAAASDASIFAIPSAKDFSDRWFADCAEPDRFQLANPQMARKDDYPRILGIDFEHFFAAARKEREAEEANRRPLVAEFVLEKRIPALNHVRNRPYRIRWSDGKARDVDLFPPPRRVSGEQSDFIFPENLTFSRSPALMVVTPGKAVVRHLRRTAEASAWLLYAHYSSRPRGRPRARLHVAWPGGRRTLRIEKGGDLIAVLDLRRADLLYNGLFSTIRMTSDEPLFLWLVSPQERGWFLLRMERWHALEVWEMRRPGWKAAARLAVARRHLGGRLPEGLAAACEKAFPGFRAAAYPAARYPAWTIGVGFGLFADQRPLIPMERFYVENAGDILDPPEIPPGARLAGPYEQLVPGFYRVIWEVAGSGGDGELELQVTGDSGLREIAVERIPLPDGSRTVSLPLRVTPSSPGWDLEFPVVNRGTAPVRIVAVRVENDPERQLQWWLDELSKALGNRGGAPDRP
jgi:hypothetical protein